MKFGKRPMRAFLQFRFFVFGFDSTAQFQLVAGDMSFLTERSKAQIKLLAEEAANHSFANGYPTVLYSPFGLSHCLLLEVPVAATEAFSNRSGLRIVIVLYSPARRKLPIGQVLSMWRIIEVSLSRALFARQDHML